MHRMGTCVEERMVMVGGRGCDGLKALGLRGRRLQVRVYLEKVMIPMVGFKYLAGEQWKWARI